MSHWPLFDAFPALASVLAPVRLAELPTPVAGLPAFGSRAWIKRDDLTHPVYGGNKIRKLEFVLADIPGLIEGAHEGVGIGDRFLGHVERTRVLLHLVSAQEENVAKAYKTVRGELEAYGNGLAEKPEIVALSQIDTLDPDERKKKAAALKKAAGKTPLLLSAVSREGLDQAQRALVDIIAEAKAAEAPVEADTRWEK